jgi:hypothetical protein
MITQLYSAIEREDEQNAIQKVQVCVAAGLLEDNKRDVQSEREKVLLLVHTHSCASEQQSVVMHLVGR